ncbi:MAG TPA: hypothetical protein VG276_06070 [Actinomycetes bacterium]|nr:hypothetical protein [Actinomycetes bacterium]
MEADAERLIELGVAADVAAWQHAAAGLVAHPGRARVDAAGSGRLGVDGGLVVADGGDEQAGDVAEQA